MKLGIAQIILERSEFKHREDYMSLPAQTPIPQTDVTLGFEIQRPENDKTQFAVRLQASSAVGALYEFSAAYVLLAKFEIEPDEEFPDDRRLLITAGYMLFPFVRELVANLTSRGRFGPTWLAPTDFSSLGAPSPTPAVAAQ